MNRLVTQVTRLAAAFPRDNATEASLAVYVEELSTRDPDTIESVLQDFIRTATHFPTVAEILEAYRYRRQRAQQSSGVSELPISRSPMPPAVKKQIEELNAAFEARSKELAEDA